MTEEVCLPEPVVVDGSADDLNRWLGRRDAFGLIAGRCSAVDVECIKRMRDGKLYLSRAENWEEFCVKFLHMSKSHVNRQLALLEKHGAVFFHVAQFTRITPATYEVIAPAISPEGIEWNGEVIPLAPENCERIAAAVAALQSAHETAAEPAAKDPLAELEALGNRLLKQFRDLAAARGRSDPHVCDAASSLQRKVDRLLLEIG